MREAPIRCKVPGATKTKTERDGEGREHRERRGKRARERADSCSPLPSNLRESKSRRTPSGHAFPFFLCADFFFLSPFLVRRLSSALRFSSASLSLFLAWPSASALSRSASELFRVNTNFPIIIRAGESKRAGDDFLMCTGREKIVFANGGMVM